MEKYYRTFIGLPFRVEQDFLDAVQELKSAMAGERISWVDPENYHVTLRFLGETKESTISEIGNSLKSGISVPEPTRVEFKTLGSFGPRKRPRVLWIGFQETDFFKEMKDQVDQSLEKCGILPAEQPFRAHLTLGRVRSLNNLKEYYRINEKMAHQFQCSVLFEQLVFFRSILGDGSPDYQVLQKIRFR